MKIRVCVFAERPTGEWFPVGTAQIGQHEGREVLLVDLDAVPIKGRLCVSLADLDVLRQDEVAGHA